MATPANSSSSDSEPEIDNSSSPNPSLTSNALAISNQSSPPLVCLFKFAGDSVAGAFMGSIFGIGYLPFFHTFMLYFDWLSVWEFFFWCVWIGFVKYHPDYFLCVCWLGIICLGNYISTGIFVIFTLMRECWNINKNINRNTCGSNTCLCL